MKLKAVSINKNEQIFLDGVPLENVTAYKLENSADSNEPAKLTVTIHVSIAQPEDGRNLGITVFDALRQYDDAESFAEMILSIAEEKKTTKAIQEFLMEELPEEGVRIDNAIRTKEGRRLIQPLSF